MTRPLDRAADGRPAAPVRILHLGLGGFFRAHQAWYTEHSPDAAAWGVAAFTGRRREPADRLAAQDCLYTLVTRTPDGDRHEVISALSAAHAGTDHAAWSTYWRRPELAAVTLTVTEAAYATRPGSGGLDLGRGDVRADAAALEADPSAPVTTVAGRLLAGLAARRRAGCGPVAIVPCDNLPGNGELTARIVRELAEAAGTRRLRAAAEHASYVTTVVDRITPSPTERDAEAVAAATGRADAAPVVTEPFTEWVLSGDFPAGRPRWEEAGARFVTDTGPYARRKLWLLNGGHSLLAYAGPLRGHTTVAEAAADPVCHAWLEQWWDEAARHLDSPEAETAAYRASLLTRFADPGIRHTLAKIAEDGAQKLPVRLLPVLRAERARGALPPGAIRVLASWLLHLRGHGAPVRDAAAPPSTGPLREAARTVLAALDPRLGEDAALVDAVAARAAEPA